MKIGIYTFHSAYNYGAMFQAHATQQALKKLGHPSEFVNLYTKEEEIKNENKKLTTSLKQSLIYFYCRLNPKMQRKYKRFRKFHSGFNLSQRFLTAEEAIKNSKEYDVHLVGSDQVWNLQRGFPNPPFYFLNFLDAKATKISYASSFGTKHIDRSYYAKLKEYLSTFKAISVREHDGVDIIKEATNLEATQVLDPTFLLSADEWNTLAVDRIIEGDYILYYGFDSSEVSKSLIINLRKRLKLPVVAMSGGVSFPFKVEHFVQDAGPKEFLSLFRDAKFVCSSSFHGMAFAIHYRKSFFTIKHPQRNSRMETIMKEFDFFDRQIEDANSVLTMDDTNLFIDYAKKENVISNAINKSYNWLENALKITGEN